MSISSVPVGSKVDFSIYGNIEGKTIFSGTVMGHVSSTIAGMVQGNGIITNHANIWPTLPEDVRSPYVNAFSAYDYVAIQAEDGTVDYIGLPWIINDTLTKQIQRIATIGLVNFSDPDASKLSRLLQTHGYEINSIAIAVSD